MHICGSGGLSKNVNLLLTYESLTLMPSLGSSRMLIAGLSLDEHSKSNISSL